MQYFSFEMQDLSFEMPAKVFEFWWEIS